MHPRCESEPTDKPTHRRTQPRIGPTKTLTWRQARVRRTKVTHLIVAMFPCERGCIWGDRPVTLRLGTIGGPLPGPVLWQSPEFETTATFVGPLPPTEISGHWRRPDRPDHDHLGCRRSDWPNWEVEHVGHHHHRLRNPRRPFPNLLDWRWDGCNVSRVPGSDPCLRNVDGWTHNLVFWTDRNVDCDYSSAYVILKTSSPDLKGFGMTFTIGRGNDIVRSDPLLRQDDHERSFRPRCAKRFTMLQIASLARKLRTSLLIWARHGPTLPQTHNSVGMELPVLFPPPVSVIDKTRDW